MGLKISPLQMTEGATWGGLTTENHLGYLAQEKPQVASELATKIYNSNFGTDMYGYLNMYDKKEFETDADFAWSLIGSAIKNVALVEARIDGTPITEDNLPGQYGAEIELVFPEAHFSDVNIIVGHKNEVYPLQIIADPIPEGSNYVYRTVLRTGSNTDFMPFEELTAGTKFSRDFSPVSHSMSLKGGDITFTAPLSMRNAMSFLRLQHKTPGNMISRPMATAFKGEDGNTYKTWTQYEDYMFEFYYRLERNNLLMFGRSNRAADGSYKDKDKSGNVLKIGSGIREQSEASNTAEYTDFDLDYFSSVMLDLSENKSVTDTCKYVVRTGKRGAIEFHKKLEKYSQLFVPNRTNDRIYKASSKFASEALGYGGQFTEYKMAGNIDVSISVDSMYDDRTRNKVEHPLGGTNESYRYDIMDLGSADGTPNIQMATVKGQDNIWGYQLGLRHPFSKELKTQMFMGSSEDSYTMHRAGYLSAMVKDPSRMASFVCTRTV